MVQMSRQDQTVVMALPGNSQCCDCGMKNPQWASVSFGNVFCLECSGVHRYVVCVKVKTGRCCCSFFATLTAAYSIYSLTNTHTHIQSIHYSSLGVHISFVRSIAMDSWTDAQLAQMKMGGNDKCNAYLQQHGIGPRTPIKPKYESPVAQLYKAILKARVEGKPEPTSLPPPAPPRSGNYTSAAASHAATDANSMERLPGESEQQYVARQTRLREEARARMAAKFGGNGASMGGVGNSTSMQGMGSDPNYNPRSGGYSNSGGGGDVLNSFSSGLGAALGVAGSYAGSVAAKLQSEDTLQSVKTVGSSFWGTLTSSVSTVAATLTDDTNDDGLSDLQRQFASQKPTQSKYAGFGSSSTSGGMSCQPVSSPSSFGAPSAVQEAPGLPGEDRNGVERLTGESDEQYVVRQTRLRDEARARMAAKFGGGGAASMGGVGSSPPPPQSSSHTLPPPSSRTSPPSSQAKTNVNANDFFSSFGA